MKFFCLEEGKGISVHVLASLLHTYTKSYMNVLLSFTSSVLQTKTYLDLKVLILY